MITNPAANTRLALDCATDGLSLVLKTADNQLFAATHPGSRTSDLLPTALQSLFTQSGTTVANLAEIRLTVGPGSFTGIRLGLATAQALKLLNPSLSILGFSTLQALAHQLAPQPSPFTLVLDAAGGQVYTQTFTAEGAPQTEAACLPLTEVPLTPTTFAQPSLLLAARSLPSFSAATLLDMPATLQLPAQPLYLKPLTYKKVAE